MKKLSILVPSVNTRINNFLPKSLNMIYGQLENSPHKDDIEVLFLVDNKTMTLGEKRNRMASISCGQYIVFIDDDDRISDDYIKEIMNAIQYNPDVICFQMEVNGYGKTKKAIFSSKFEKEFDTEDAFYRLPHEKMVIKRELFLDTPHRDILIGDDYYFSLDLKPKIKTEYQINKVLYYYDYDINTSECIQ